MNDLNVIRFSQTGDENGLVEWPEMDASELVTAAPIQNACVFYSDSNDQLTAGVWNCTPYESTMEPYAVDEFMHVLEGSVTIVHAGGDAQTFKAGDSFYIPKGTICSWRQTESILKYYVIFDDGTPAVPNSSSRATLLNPTQTLPVLENPDPTRFLGEVPDMSQLNAYKDTTAQFAVGMWQASSLALVPAIIGRSEFVHMLEGNAEVVNGDNVIFEASAGDSFLVPIGMGYQWRHDGIVRKVFCNFTPLG
jgi:uncharacterized cupin superfamily protein